MPTDAALLAEVPFFQLLDEHERTELAAQMEVVNYKVGEVVFSYGDPGGAMYIIRSGEVEVFFKDDTGGKIVLERPVTGDVFGELSLLDGGSRTATVLVLKDLEALRVDRGDLDQFFALHPAAALDMLTMIGRRMRITVERLRHTATRNVNEEIEDHRTVIQKSADWIAEFSGSIPFLMIHVVLFTLWIGWNVAPFLPQFDPFPFGLLTMSVSLEAIILSVFVLLSQNRQAAKEHVRSDIEYDVNLKAELEIAHLHEKVDEMNAKILERFTALEHHLGKEAKV